MMLGDATGKGLNIKGKSAKHGVLSGFVPFLQISEEAHKAKVNTCTKDGRMRVFFRSVEAREEVMRDMEAVLDGMVTTVEAAREQILREERGEIELDDDAREPLLVATTTWAMADPQCYRIDEYAPTGSHGIDLPERLFWEAFVARQDISHQEGWETGRASEPAFMDLNLHATRDHSPSAPKAVVWQFDAERPMNPRGLLMAYEEATVKPVASDIDAFVVGSRGVTFDPLPEEQVSFAQSLDGACGAHS